MTVTRALLKMLMKGQLTKKYEKGDSYISENLTAPECIKDDNSYDTTNDESAAGTESVSPSLLGFPVRASSLGSPECFGRDG